MTGPSDVASTAGSIKVVLLDIEGTVCPISFVKDVLFPYALEALPDTLKTKWSSPQFAPYRDAFPPEHRSSEAAFVEHVEDLVRRDVKASYLKSLQGYLWVKGYHSGVLKAPLFADVAPLFLIWKKNRIRIMIYSSGSVPAQKLLFKHTNGNPADLTPMVTDFFDTVNAGAKTEASSYEKIARKYERYPRGDWLFLSDNVREVEAAIAAGMKGFVVDRPGNPELSSEAREKYKVIQSFDELEDLS